MADTASAQLRRILTIVPRFADDQIHSIAELASAVGTTPKQMANDLVSITQRYDTPGFLECIQVMITPDTVCMISSEFPRPMRLTMSELCALELGLTMIRAERTPAEHATIDSAMATLRKTISQLPSNERYERIRHGTIESAGDVAHLTILRSAHRDRHKVRVTYRSGGATETSARDICPQVIMYAEQMWYVLGVGDDNEARHYRLDRISDVEILNDTFEPNSTLIATVIERGLAFASDTTRHMTVHYSPRIARWVAEREGVALSNDGSLTIDHPVADDTWAVRHVLQFGPEAVVVAPPDIRELVKQRLAEMSASASAP